MKKKSILAKKIKFTNKIILLIIIIIATIIFTSSYFFINNIEDSVIENYSFSRISDNENIAQINLYINELMADNDITIPGPDMNYPDWIELYNNDSEPLNISGMYLTDDLTNPTKWQFPNNTIIDSGGYLLIWGDGYNSTNEAIYASFQLNANGDSVALFASDGETVIDSVTFRKQIRDTSYGRLPDGSNDWEYLSDPSPGESNGERLTDGKIPAWVLPILIILVICILIAVIFIRKILIERDFK